MKYKVGDIMEWTNGKNLVRYRVLETHKLSYTFELYQGNEDYNLYKQYPSLLADENSKLYIPSKLEKALL